MIDVIDKNIEDNEDNILLTRHVVKLAEGYNVNVQAELGYVSKPNREVEYDKFTEPSDAKRFVEETGISSLAIAIKSKHGFYKGEPKLDIDRLIAIKNVTDTYLVLHGASGIPSETLREAIINGITKVNVATDSKDLFMKSLKEILKDSNDIDLRNIFPLAINEIQKMIEQKIKTVSMIN